MIFTIILSLTSILVVNSEANGQTHSEITLMKSLPLYKLQSRKVFRKVQAREINMRIRTYELPPGINSFEFSKNNTNEIEMIFSALFLAYKYFVSSQDGSSCAFTPSCSEYGMEAIKKQGVFIGIINTIDRLMRCNGMSYENYSIVPNTTLLFDPVE